MNATPVKGRGRPGRPSQTAYPGEPNAWEADWFRTGLLPAVAKWFSLPATPALSWRIQSYTGLRKPGGRSRPPGTWRWAGVVGSGVGRNSGPPGQGGPALLCGAVAVGVCGPSLDLGWNNCNRRAASVASWARRAAVVTGGGCNRRAASAASWARRAAAATGGSHV